MKQKYNSNRMQKLICLFLLVPLILGITISGMRASTQALYRAWNLKAYSMEDVAWECEVLDEKEERNEKDRGNLTASQVQNIRHTFGFENMEDTASFPQQERAEHKNIDVTRQIARDRALLGMPEMELNHVICLDDEDMDACLPRADEYQVWYAEADIGQNKMVRISDTENVTMLHTGYIINKNMKKGYPLKENLEPSGDHISRYNDNFYLI